MAKNTNLSKAKKEKNDEFYTQMNDVAEELRHYNEHFKTKLYCATVMILNGLHFGNTSI
ncbi:MAG: adenine-specific methyltransferase EcoRI family protein [Blautia sp.]